MTKTEVLNIADRCLLQWKAHFDRFYTVPIPGDREKKQGLEMGIKSLRDDIIRALEEGGEKRVSE